MKNKNFKAKMNEKKIREDIWEKTGWGKVANWYQNTISSQKSTQKDLILPELLKFFPITEVKGKRILDIGCGTGFFLKEYLKGDTGADKSLGLDLDGELLELAEQYLHDEKEEGKVAFMKGDASNMFAIGEKSFEIALSVESIPNIRDLKALAQEVKRILTTGGKFICVVNHPAFRVPQSSDWHFDKAKNRQGRVVYKYKTPHEIKIDMNPGNKNKTQKVYTYTYHRPFEEYINVFAKAGLKIREIREVCSNKQSEKGPRSLPENDARKEIPMFLFMSFIKE